ncbi:MAG TPA: o-succinylbenzoate synthase, partial [Cytophagaceae bacterium]|nr:o-succinylbenzoate synthase [Cytophagaceae bacterium]
MNFKFDAGTSRGIMRHKDTWFINIWDQANPLLAGRGECGPLKGLSIDDRKDFEEKLSEVCQRINQSDLNELAGADLVDFFQLNQFPSILFGLETAILDLINGGEMMIFKNSFSSGLGAIPINGLVWMGDKDFMERQIKEKISEGYTCIKMKIGAIDFDAECSILQDLRKKYPEDKITLRLDANGVFQPVDALEKLGILSKYQIHSIEQPIRQGQEEQMKELCKNSAVHIALDEELIGKFLYEEKESLLKNIQPAYIILKPSLLGGFKSCREWIAIAESLNIGWWITSALESNIGLNAIAQFAATFSPSI